MAKQVWVDPNNSKNVIFIDSKVAPPLQPGTVNVSAGNAVVPAGFIKQIGWDGFMDSGGEIWLGANQLTGTPQLGVPQPNIFIPGVPYFTGGWPPDPLLGQPFHTAPSYNPKTGIQD